MTINIVPVKLDYESRKKLGIFYTPEKVTQILTDWAIRKSDDTVFEPSFGGCGFLESSCQRLKDLGNKNPIEQLYGCDVDKNAFNSYLFPKYGEDILIQGRFIEKDFLALTLNDFKGEGFSAIIGNPPYISYHNMSDAQRTACKKVAESFDISVDKKASLWAYFVMHGCTFLASGGRIAWVLPGSFLHARYSNEIKKFIASHFRQSIVIQLGQRIFASAGTDENTAILLADGWSSSSTDKDLRVYYVSDVISLENFVSSWRTGGVDGVKFTSRVNLSLLNKEALAALQRLETENATVKVGDLAEVVIGVVTGANKFFVIDRKEADRWNLSDETLTPIFSRFRFSKGVSLELNDLKEAERQNFPCLFVDSLRAPKSLALKVYFWSFPEKQKNENVTFQKRSIWYQPQDSDRIPEAFFSYMHHEGPRLILNKAGVNSTNTIHRVFFKNYIVIKDRKKASCLSSTEKQLAAISIMSTYSQISAEIEGRVYGSGVLKHEPSEVKRISLLWKIQTDNTLIRKTFKKIDELLRQDMSDEARRTADEFLLDTGRYQQELEILNQTLQALRRKRYSKGQSKL